MPGSHPGPTPGGISCALLVGLHNKCSLLHVSFEDMPAGGRRRNDHSRTVDRLDYGSLHHGCTHTSLHRPCDPIVTSQYLSTTMSQQTWLWLRVRPHTQGAWGSPPCSLSLLSVHQPTTVCLPQSCTSAPPRLHDPNLRHLPVIVRLDSCISTSHQWYPSSSHTSTLLHLPLILICPAAGERT